MISGIYGVPGRIDIDTLQYLKKKGFNQLEISDVSMDFRSVSEMGFDIFYVLGAFGRGENFQDEYYLSQDTEEKRQEWFGSTCPNRDDVRRHNIEKISNVMENKYISGVIVDGARFSSFCSSNTTDSFYTCFCPVCKNRIQGYGYDYYQMKEHVRELKKLFCGQGQKNIISTIRKHGFNKQGIFSLLPGLKDWFDYKNRCIKKYLKSLNSITKNYGINKKLGIYIFSPSLSWLVGQDYKEIMSVTDFISPMIYRCYDDRPGPACLNTEISAIAKQIKAGLDLNDKKAIEYTSDFLEMDLGEYNSIDEMEKELNIDVIYDEVKKSRMILGNSSKLIPIILLDDPKIVEAIKLVRDAGVDGVDLFHYNEELIKYYDPALYILNH